MLRRRLRFFLEAMQDVNSLFKLRHKHHTVNALAVFDADFLRARSDSIKRFPVLRVQASLHFAQLKPRLFPRLLGESQQVVV